MMLKEDKEIASNGKQKDSDVREETSVVSGTMKISVHSRHQEPLHPLNHQYARQPCRDYLKGICTKSL